MIAMLIRSSVAARGWVIVGVLALLAVGLWLAVQLRVDAFPDLTNVQVQVLTTSPGLGTEEVERLVTVPIERAISGSPGLTALRSVSRPGVSAVTAVFTDDTDLWRARQIVGERVAAAREQIPAGVSPPELGPPTTGLGEVFQFTIASDRHPPGELTRIFQRDVAPRLRAVPGVVEVNAWGGAPPQHEVSVDPYALAARGLRLSEVERAVAGAVGVEGGGYRVLGAEQEALRALANPQRPEELADVIVRAGSPPVRLADIATLRTGAPVPVGIGTVGGEGQALFIMVQMIAGGDARRVAAQVRAQMQEIEPSLPAGVAVQIAYDREPLIAGTLRTAATSLVEGGVLVIVVLLLLLGDLRAGLLVASVVPMALIGALAGLHLLGFSGNLMSLGAVDFGLVVDGAVVMVEGVVALGAVGAASASARRRAVADTAVGLGRPILFASAVLMLAYAPILLLPGTEGRLFRPMAATVVLAVGVAIVLALTWVPAVASLLIPARPPRRTSVIRWLDRPYAALVAACVRRPGWMVAGSLVVVLASVGALATRGTAFVPRLGEGDLVIMTDRLPSIAPDEVVARATRVERALLAFPEVQHVATRTGSPFVATDPMGLGESDIMIRLRPRSSWTTAPDIDGLSDAMVDAVREADPDAALTVTQPIEMRFSELLEGVPTDVGLSIYGDDLDAMLATAARAAALLERVPGAADVRVPSVEGLTVVDVEVEPAPLLAYGLSSADVLAAVEALRAGREVGQVLRGEFRDAVVVRIALPRDVPLDDLPITLPSGVAVPLSEVARLTRRPMPAAVRRDGGRRRVTVLANVRGRDVGSFVGEAERALAQLELPDGSYLRWSGEHEQLRSAAWGVALVVPLVLLSVLALLRVALGALRPALIIALNVPIAVSGGVFALVLAGLPVSMSAVTGFVALFGIAVMNGIVLVARVAELRRECDPVEAALQGASERFRPVLLTATIAAIGFVPMALSTGLGAEVQRPLAVVIIGGIVTSTALTLLVVPAVCARWWPGHRNATTTRPPA